MTSLISEIISSLFDKKPKLAMAIITVLVGASGAGVGAYTASGSYASKELVLEKHAEAMERVKDMENGSKVENDRLYNAISRIENKLDMYILRSRH